MTKSKDFFIQVRPYDIERYGMYKALIIGYLTTAYLYFNNGEEHGKFYRSINEIARTLCISSDTVSRHCPTEAEGWRHRSGYKPGTTERTTWWEKVDPVCDTDCNNGINDGKNQDSKSQKNGDKGGDAPTSANEDDTTNCGDYGDKNGDKNSCSSFEEISSANADNPSSAMSRNHPGEGTCARTERVSYIYKRDKKEHMSRSARSGTGEGLHECPHGGSPSGDGFVSLQASLGITDPNLTNDPFCGMVKNDPNLVDVKKSINSGRKRNYAIQRELLDIMGIGGLVKPGIKLYSAIKARLNQGYTIDQLHFVARAARSHMGEDEIYSNPMFVFSESGVAKLLTLGNAKKSHSGFSKDVERRLRTA